MIRKCLTIYLIVSMILLSSCGENENREDKTADIEFTVMQENEIPSKLKELMTTKKQNAFQLTYCDGEYMYLAKGYGEQETGGFSIRVDALYETANFIYFDATLEGPSEEEEVNKAKSYPYIVVKFEMRDKEVKSQ